MPADRYSIRIGGTSIAENVSYKDLLSSVVRFTVEAAVARAADLDEWAFEELRRRGLQALEVTHNGKAVWCDAADFESERSAAIAQGAGEAFDAANELQVDLCEHLDAHLRELWQRAGYATNSLVNGMRPLFAELEHDATERARSAQNGLVTEIIEALNG